MKRICANCKHYGKDKGGGYCERTPRNRVRVDGRARACGEFKPLVSDPIVRCAVEGAVAGMEKKMAKIRDLSEKVLEGLRKG